MKLVKKSFVVLLFYATIGRQKVSDGW